jgi:hypothetical protein
MAMRRTEVDSSFSATISVRRLPTVSFDDVVLLSN